MTRRELLGLLYAAVARRVVAAQSRPRRQSKSVILVTIGGIRRQESFSATGLVHVPRLAGDLAPQALFYPFTVNEGVTSHFNTISSILTGRWQHVDDWGSQPAADPTLFHSFQKQLHLGPEDT